MIDSCYRIPLYFMPPVSFSDNNKSALANAGFVEEATDLNCYSLITVLRQEAVNLRFAAY